MAELLFGTGGTPNSTPKPPSTIDGIERIAELGLGCMELEFVRGVHMSKDTALQVAAAANKLKVKLTAHAPYFINLNSAEIDIIKASQYRILQTARIAKLCGAESIAVHAAFYGGESTDKVYKTVKKYLAEVLEQLSGEKNNVWIRPEIMGKGTQFGTVEEIVNLSAELPQVLPVVDFAHWHARTGQNNTYDEFAAVLEQIKQKLGKKALDSMHMHISGIKYGLKGELKHLNLQESDLNYPELMKALKDYRVGGFAICESPNLEEDALLLKSTYESL
ncbi:MAG: TIM barrel protein [Dehalococcoidales bacterium]|nr:TIM barrel protein [Dehalococcoidales bacterium]